MSGRSLQFTIGKLVCQSGTANHDPRLRGNQHISNGTYIYTTSLWIQHRKKT